MAVAVGESTLGRLLDVLGRVGDRGQPLPADAPRWPIHRKPPPLSAQSGVTKLFATGIKVIDLLAPLAQGGKAAMFGAVDRSLAPFDFARFHRARNPAPPIISAPPQILLAELCEALTLSLAAENEARMRAMSAAKSNVARMLDELVARSRQLRQKEITNEIIELGGRVRRDDGARKPWR